MNSTNTGGPAFPGVDYANQFGKKNPEGMTLRDYFAAQMLPSVFGTSMRTPPSPEAIAKAAYAIADAMLKAREA